MSQLVMLDLFSGLGGAHAAMTDRGWKVISVDLNPKVRPDIVADVRALPLEPFLVDLLWASPHCSEYSALWQFGGWHKNAPFPDLSPWCWTRRLIREWRPRYYCIENVRAAQRVWGKAPVHFGSFYLWTDIPVFGKPDHVPMKMGIQSNRQCVTRTKGYQHSSRIPYILSEIVASAVESLTEAAA